MKLSMKSVVCNVIFLFFIICTFEANASDCATFDSFYIPDSGLGILGWSIIIGSAVATGALAFFTFGASTTTIPVWISAVGTWIGTTAGLSGIAATNFGLALLGGGSVAAGGLGMAGGVALLTAIMSFGVDTTLTYGTDIALEKWNYAKFIKVNKDMNTLPLPRNEKGGKAYRTAFSYLEKNYNFEKQINDADNQSVLTKAKEILKEKMTAESDEKNTLKNNTLLSLLYLQINDFKNAQIMAAKARQQAQENEDSATLPCFIEALSTLAFEQYECDENILHLLRCAYYPEGDNKLIPVMTASCMDRIMYRYHYGQITIDFLSTFGEIITSKHIDKELVASSVEIYTTRCLIELKRTRQDIFIVVKDKSMMADKAVVAELRKRYNRYQQLISVLQSSVLPKAVAYSKYFSEDSQLTVDKLSNLLGDYWADLPALDRQIKYVPQDLKNSSSTSKPKKWWNIF